ncbi:Abi family protein [Staphylococcus nepalensis]|uniref:Abi family protein n=1 Tax=Staphylococcus nepalensis TaxID=214473 RepID=UPI003015BE20
MEKYYTSHKKRLDTLRDRGMLIPKDSGKQRNIVKKYNYYSLINGYKEPFLENVNNYPKFADKNEDFFIKGTTPEQLEALLGFDEKLRMIFLKRILKIEEKLKDVLVQSFYEVHTENSKKKSTLKTLHRESEYLRRNYYNLGLQTTYQVNEKSGYRYTTLNRVKYDSTMLGSPRSYIYDKTKTYDKLIAKIYAEIGRQRRKSKYIASYLDNHTYLPMWVLTNILTFGQIGKLYEIQNSDIQHLILKKLSLKESNIDDRISIINLLKVIQILTIYRNSCAHNERIYCEPIYIPIDDDFMGYLTKFPQAKEVISLKHRNKYLTKTKSYKLNSYRRGLYTLMFCISLFLNKRELSSFKNEFNTELSNLNKKLSTRAYNNVLNQMGLNFNWFNHL